MIELVGWFASFCFATCAIPQVITCVSQGHGRGISKLFMWIWLSGELSMMPYIIIKHGWDWPIMTNLILNSLFILIIMKYIYFPRRDFINE